MAENKSQDPSLLKEIQAFKRSSLADVESPEEKNLLIQEAKRLSLIENFDKKTLQRAQTLEKIVLPSKEDIERERSENC